MRQFTNTQSLPGLSFIFMICMGLGNAQEQPSQISFSRDILPILSDNCFACHGQDDSHRKAKLRLDTRAFALAGTKGRPAIVPGDLTTGTLLERIRTRDDDELMPPSDSHRKRLSPQQIALFEQWIAHGAEWGRHWSFLPPQRPAVPVIAGVTHPIDAFIRQRLQQQQLIPAPSAAPHQRARRLSYTLTGLPPTPEQVDSLQAHPDYYDTLVDTLLASPHYGERMAMWWLDAARYADTDGFQADATRHNWPWRDWVIQAFNSNMPYDQFTIEQLAGDLLAHATPDQRIATCFNRNHMCNGEGGRDPEESRIDYVRDRVNTTATVWMGLTFACAQCHTHKFDPITQHDYYSFSAFFNSIDENGKAGKDAKPFLAYESPFVARALAEGTPFYEAAQQRQQQASRDAEAPFASWLSARIATNTNNYHAWQPLIAASLETDEGTTLTQEADGIIQASGKNPNQDAYRVIAGVTSDRVTGIRLEIFPHPTHSNGSYSFGKAGHFVLSDVKVQVRRLSSSQVRDIAVEQAIADVEDDGKKFNGYGAIKGILDDDPRNGWSTRQHDPHVVRTAQLALAEPLKLANDEELVVELRQRSTLGDANIGRFRISVTAEAGPAVQSLMASPLEQLAAEIAGNEKSHNQPFTVSKDLRARLKKQFLEDYVPYQQAKHTFERIKRQQHDISQAQKVEVMVMAERPEPRTTHVLMRGVWDHKGDVVTPHLPPAISPWQDKQAATRLDLAHWLVNGEHPLTARVLVNHLWQLCFGQGLVRTVDDFGLQGEQPSHPELLDWLAVECVEHRWDIKHILRLLVTSQTFQQQSTISAEALERDPENRLLARGARFRLPSWMLRDGALAMADLLNTALYGPPVHPYQPPGVWEQLFMGRFTYEPSLGPAQYRRTLYAFWRRTIAPTFLFDSAQRRSCEVQRYQTNTPLQALTLLNDVSYLEAAQALAARCVDSGSDDSARLQLLARIILTRSLQGQELSSVTTMLQRARAYYQENPADARSLLHIGQLQAEAKRSLTDHAAYMLVASMFLNLDEVLNYE